MTQPKHVLTMVDSLLPGGAERVAVEVACALDPARFTSEVIVTRGDGPLRRLLDDAGVPVTLLERRSARDLAPWRIVHRRLASGDVDLVHAHKFGSNTWAAMLTRMHGVPLIAHEHNFSATPSRARQRIARHVIAPAAARVLCVSESVAEVERANGGSRSVVDVVYNGVSIDAAVPRAAARSELALDGQSFVVGIVARLRPEKAHEVLLEAVAALARRGRDVRLCIVGSGPRRTELTLLAAQLGLERRVTWAGDVEDAARIAAAFDAAVICSDWEGLPLAALESMAARVPLVATRVGGLPQLLAGGAGVLVPPRDPAAMADALAGLMDDPARARAMAASGYDRIAANYSFTAMVQRIQAIYDEVLHAPRASETQREAAA